MATTRDGRPILVGDRVEGFHPVYIDQTIAGTVSRVNGDIVTFSSDGQEFSLQGRHLRRRDDNHAE